MGTLARYHAENLPELMERITRNSIGMDDYLNKFWNDTTTSNYPPYNLIQVNNVESRLEIALAGFKKDNVKVFTEFGQLHVEGKQEDKETESLSIKDWPSGLSIGSGHSQMIPRYETLNSPTDCWWSP